MNYVYRYDPLLTHLRMHGDMLRARRWSSKEGSWKHEPLLAVESTLADGESIFRISFWKSLEAAKSRMGWRLWSEMHVLQRVRDDHPFFSGFHRTDDDFLVDTAWLYWQTSPREPNQEWSRDGIAKCDIEILDLDGRWRPMPDSTLMASSHSRYERKGFRPHYFMTGSGQPAVVFWTSRLLPPQSGDADVALLVMHPQESSRRIYHDITVAQSIVDRFRASGFASIPAERLRLFVVDEGRHLYDASQLLEIPLSGHWRADTPKGGWSMRWPWRQSEKRYQYVVKAVGEDDWRWNNLESDLGAAVLSAFELPTLGQTLTRYMTVLEEANEDALTCME
jgi:hypothetical protein